MQIIRKSFTPFPYIPVALAFAWGAAWGLLFRPVNRFLHQPVMVPPYAFEGQCTEIIDADTIIVRSKLDGNYKVTFASARAPAKGTKGYLPALQFTTKALLNRAVTVQPTWGEDTGVIDGWVYIGPTCFDAEFIKAGHGKKYH